MSAVESRENRDWRDCTDQLDRSEIRRIVAQGELVRIRHRGEVVARVKEVDAAGAVAVAVARAITGSRWSGPLFFGLKSAVEEYVGGRV